MNNKDVVIIGAGLTGLTTALQLKKKGLSVVLLEEKERVGGQIQTFREDGFLYESGPNTGSGASQEVIELFEELAPDCEIEFARKEAEKRLIWKNEKFHILPSNPIAGLTTSLFTFSDKIRFLGEPWRKKGTDPDETVASLAGRRLGKSFVDYAVDPFLSGIYAGDAHSLITRHALPKLYNLEQNYGSFIRGAIAKAKEKKKNPNAVKKKGSIFSVKGGMENLPKSIVKKIGEENVFISARDVNIQQQSDNSWNVSFTQNDETLSFTSKHVISTVGAYALPKIFPFIPTSEMDKLTNIRYAPIVQIAVGVKDRGNLQFNAFGGLVSSKDNEDFLGILFPSSCFSGRAPKNGMLFSFFMGGIKRQELTRLSDQEIEQKVLKAFHRMLGFPADKQPDLIKIFRHKYAIPQYEKSSEQRFETIKALQQKYKGLHIAGNLRDGIGMSHRIVQGNILTNEVVG